MHKFVSLNYRIISPEQARLRATSSASFYGRGVFTSLAVYSAKPFLWEKHWRRLNANARKINLDLNEFDEDAVKTNLSELIARNKISDARARITFFDESLSGVWSFESRRKTSILITAADFRERKPRLDLTVSPFRSNSTSPLAGVKSCNYLENLLALETAKRSGLDEAVRLNERGEIVSASMANVFWAKDGRLFTPSLETGCLGGTLRALIMENFPVRETKSQLYELTEADEVFLTSSGIGIAEIRSIDNHKFAAPLEKTKQMQSFLAEQIEKSP